MTRILLKPKSSILLGDGSISRSWLLLGYDFVWKYLDLLPGTKTLINQATLGIMMEVLVQHINLGGSPESTGLTLPINICSLFSHGSRDIGPLPLPGVMRNLGLLSLPVTQSVGFKGHPHWQPRHRVQAILYTWWVAGACFTTTVVKMQFYNWIRTICYVPWNQCLFKAKLEENSCLESFEVQN